tara:strand:+ start:169 stop:3006 length:2838 start_codon:yes stop_codon:yes gene_type:complete
MENIFKLSQQQDSTSLSGPEVDDLIFVVHEMFNLGAPDSEDHLGFDSDNYYSKTMKYIRGINTGSTIPTNIAIDAINRLNRHKNTQLHKFTDYEALKAGIIRLVQNLTQTEEGNRLNYSDKIIQHTGRGGYGKEEFLIPQFGRVEKVPTNRAVRDKMRELSEGGDSRYEQVSSTYGKDYPVFKAFSFVRSKVDHYEIHPDFMSEIATVLEDRGYDVSVLRRFTEQANQHYPSVEDKPSKAEGVEDKPSKAEGDEKKPKAKMHSVFDETEGKWMASVKVKDFDLTAKYQAIFNETVKYIFFGVTNQMDEHENHMQLASVKEYGRYDPSTKKRKDLGWKEPYGVPKYTKYLRGSINSFIDFGRNLHNRGFNVDEVRDTFASLRQSGAFNDIIPGVGPREQRIRGSLDGFESKTHEEEVEKFNSSAKSYESSFFDGKDLSFYKEQLEGMEFLYSRQSAILGDDTGVGKTVQCVVAADMRIKQSGGKCIIVTMPSVVDQYREDIIKITGVDESEVSDSPYSDAKYRVLGYSAFSTPSTREETVAHLMEEAIAGAITVMVLDEIHATKTVSSKRSELIGNITKMVPFVWGASATTVANTPADLYNQLRIINHDFGKMPEKQFNALFGTKSRGKNLPKIEQYKRADKIKEILFEQQVYTRRSKQSIREDMPEQKTLTSYSSIDHEQMTSLIDEDLRGKKSTPVVQLGAFRKIIAQMKVPHTISMAREILSQGKKVAIFTGSIRAGNLLNQGLSDLLDELEIPGGVARIKGGMTPETRRRVIDGFKNTNKGSRVIIIAIKAGGTGLDFPNILEDVIVNDFEWSVKDDDQSLGRFYRINSKEDINVTYNVADVDLDKLLYQKLSDKKEIASRIKNWEAKETDLLVAGMREGNARLAEIREEKYKAYEEMEQINQEDIDFGGSFNNFDNGTTLASSHFSLRKSWYGILKTQHKH